MINQRPEKATAIKMPAVTPAHPFPAPKSQARYAVRDLIQTLDPLKDHQYIGYLSVCYDFPWDTTRALEFALFRVFGVAKGTPLLVSTGEFLQRTQKRYDDTVLILSEILENGYDSERGRAALRRMNQQHGHYTIPNDEMLYTLSTFIYEPIRWNARFGWRKLTEQEKLATYYGWCEIGRRMNIKNIPTSYEAFERFNEDYERTQFRYTNNNQQLAEVTRNLMLSWVLPKALWPVGAPFIHALLDDRMCAAVGFARPTPAMRKFVESVVRARSWLIKHLPARRAPRLITRQRSRTYPNGYRIEELGARP
jgi:hypothetical protein